MQHSSISRVYSSMSVTKGIGSLAEGGGALASAVSTLETPPTPLISDEPLCEEVSAIVVGKEGLDNYGLSCPPGDPACRRD